jgi:hypothetical protein
MWPFKNKPKPVKDVVNQGYICARIDPINTVNDLSVGEWNQRELQKSFNSGLIRYCMQSEVDQAIVNGRVK